MKPIIYFLRLRGWPILQQLQLEEALLRTDDTNWCLVNESAPPAIVMGISNQPDQVLHPSFFEKKPVPVIRRFSGGGTVFIDEQTFFTTFICQEEAFNIPPFPDKVFHWTRSFYKPLFKGLDFNLRENDYVIGDQKFGGNAQYMCKRRWLHHTSFLWSFHPDSMKYLIIPAKAPHYRKNRPHADFLCRLSTFFSNMQAFEESLKARLHTCFSIEEAPIGMALQVLQRPHRKSTMLLKI